MRTSGTARAGLEVLGNQSPIRPSDAATTRALLLMFCALNGATFKP